MGMDINQALQNDRKKKCLFVFNYIFVIIELKTKVKLTDLT